MDIRKKVNTARYTCAALSHLSMMCMHAERLEAHLPNHPVQEDLYDEEVMEIDDLTRSGHERHIPWPFLTSCSSYVYSS